jgi:hypothetical protein
MEEFGHMKAEPDSQLLNQHLECKLQMFTLAIILSWLM